jgi:hypothetical protein
MPPPWLMESMRAIRPAIEVGWQIPVLLSVYLEQRSKEAVGGPPAMTKSEILRDYERLVAERLERWSKSEADMVAAFGSVRSALCYPPVLHVVAQRALRCAAPVGARCVDCG